MTLDDLTDHNAAFRGQELNTEKLTRLTALRSACRALAEAVPEIESPMLVFDNTCRNAAAQITMPVVFILEQASAKNMLSALMTNADDVIFSALDGNRIAISFTVVDMWTAYHFDGTEKN